MHVHNIKRIGHAPCNSLACASFDDAYGGVTEKVGGV
jgi:hypothetical protein